MNIAILGTGAYGLALALMFHKNDNVVKMWTKFEDEKERILKDHENKVVLPGVKIPEDILISNNLQEVVESAELIVIAVPAAFVDDVVALIQDLQSETGLQGG